MSKTEPKDQPLFGPVDQVINTLESERSWVKAEIDRCVKAINRNKDDIDIFQARLKNIDESIAYVRKQTKAEPATAGSGD